jgi:hypothetical protein
VHYSKDVASYATAEVLGALDGRYEGGVELGDSRDVGTVVDK